ncbi:hypothetical protein [Anabaena catenula]|uniref:Apea-like HEPN domain-containing protein n=1 Tax=Anabaena catenula FACHB-362 TaxID=2692877 RepID=A0ABR8J9Q9_9NOST|nr:hypothetical protein [Anabaena catenula]MBD2694559.1 hypothetical protein [Anabaena catenula FACHB-362]
MSFQNNSAAIEFELNLIKSDVHFYHDFMPKFLKQQSAGTLIFGLMPYLSLFTVESYNYLQKTFPDYTKTMSFEYEQIIRNSRMRVKFFDDTINKVSGTFELLDWISEFYEEWFINSHKGCLSSLKRYLQPDLGIFAYDGHIIGSTHTGFLFTGLGKENLSKNGEDMTAIIGNVLYSVAQELGAYLAQLCTWTEFVPIKTNSFSYIIQDDKLGYKDVKSVDFFPSVFNRYDTTSINFSLLLFLSTINFIRHILTRLMANYPEIFFKLKFITLYHLASSLERLQNYCYPQNLLTEISKHYFKNILNDKELKKIRSKIELRNILVHYQLAKIPNSLLSPSFNLKYLVEYFFSGESFEEIDKKVDDQISRISDILEQWLNWSIKPNEFLRW